MFAVAVRSNGEKDYKVFFLRCSKIKSISASRLFRLFLSTLNVFRIFSLTEYLLIMEFKLYHRGKSGKSHNTGFKSRQRVNRLGSSTGIKGKKNEQNVRKLLGVY